MARPQSGDTVRVEYVCIQMDGTEFESTGERGPIEFVLGDGFATPGFEAAVMGLEPGESVTVTLAPEQAFGDYRIEAIQQVSAWELQDYPSMAPGTPVRTVSEDGREFNGRIAASMGDLVILDFNHPLAGQDVTFEIKLVEIVGL